MWGQALREYLARVLPANAAANGGAATVELGATSARLHGRGAVWHGDEHGREHVFICSGSASRSVCA